MFCANSPELSSGYPGDLMGPSRFQRGFRGHKRFSRVAPEHSPTPPRGNTLSVSPRPSLVFAPQSRGNALSMPSRSLLGFGHSSQAFHKLSLRFVVILAP